MHSAIFFDNFSINLRTSHRQFSRKKFSKIFFKKFCLTLFMNIYLHREAWKFIAVRIITSSRTVRSSRKVSKVLVEAQFFRNTSVSILPGICLRIISTVSLSFFLNFLREFLWKILLRAFRKSFLYEFFFSKNSSGITLATLLLFPFGNFFGKSYLMFIWEIL